MDESAVWVNAAPFLVEIRACPGPSSCVRNVCTSLYLASPLGGKRAALTWMKTGNWGLGSLKPYCWDENAFDPAVDSYWHSVLFPGMSNMSWLLAAG